MEEQQEGPTLADFVSEEKINAFAESYAPLSHFEVGCEEFGDYRLRMYFKANICSLGDPLTIYLTRLREKGFLMHGGIHSDEPVLYVRRKAW